MTTEARVEGLVLGSRRFLHDHGGGGGHGGKPKTLDGGQGGAWLILIGRWSLEWSGKGGSEEPTGKRCWADQSREERWGSSRWQERDFLVQGQKSEN